MSLTTESDELRTVQVWKLKPGHEQWEKGGCGLVSAQHTYDEEHQMNGLCLSVHSEEGKLYLKQFVSNDIRFEVQGTTMIVWQSENMGKCLSFQTEEGCNRVFQQINEVQNSARAEFDDTEEFGNITDNSIPIELPPCELSKLDEIRNLLESAISSPTENKGKLADTLEEDTYIPKLINIFHMCEDLENTEGLHTLFGIFKAIFLLEKNNLFEIMFLPENIMDVVGILEYDPLKKERTPHREYLNEFVQFKEVIPIHNEQLMNKIHQTYRVQYIKDILVPVPSLFDEGMSTLSTFIFFNKLDICKLIKDDTHFLEELFEKLTDDELSDEKRKEAMLLLRELCLYSQSMQLENRGAFIKVLSDHGLLQTIEQLMNIDDMEMRSAMVDTIVVVVDFNPSLVRTHLCKEVDPLDEDSMLLNTLIDLLLNSNDQGLGMILSQLLKTILDPANMDPQNKTEKAEFLSFFYRHCMHNLTAPILAVTATDELTGKDDYKRATVLDYIVDILTFCVEHHQHTIRNYIVSKDMLRRVLVLMQSRHKFLGLAALRFCRKIVAQHDEVFNRCIIIGKLIKPIVKCFINNGKRYNLLNSAILEFFEFLNGLNKDNLKIHVAENHLEDLRDVSYVNTFANIERSYEQYKDRIERGDESNTSQPPIGIIHSSTRKQQRDDRTMDKDEESWFDSEDDELSDLTQEGIIGHNDIESTNHSKFKDIAFLDSSESKRTDSAITANGPISNVHNNEIQSADNLQNHVEDLKPSNPISSNQETIFTNNTWITRTVDDNKTLVNSKLLNKPLLQIKINSTSLSLNHTDDHTQNGSVPFLSSKNNGLSKDTDNHHAIKAIPALTSLVDYPDDDDEEDEEAEGNKINNMDDEIPSSPAKKQRVNLT